MQKNNLCSKIYILNVLQLKNIDEIGGSGGITLITTTATLCLLNSSYVTGIFSVTHVRLLVKMAEEVNAGLTTSHNHIKITTELQNNHH